MSEQQPPNVPPPQGVTPPPAPEAPPTDADLVQDKDARQMAMLCHLLAIFTGFLGPLIVWLVKKDDHPFIDEQGKEALNFQFTVLIAAVGAGLSMLLCIGFIALPAVGVLNLVFTILATVAANKGEHYRYPISIRFLQ